MYIVFEWIVGSGKSTQSKNLVEYLRNAYPDREVIHVREPGSTPIAEDIRYLCQWKEWEDEEMHPLTNAYLYAAARAQTLHTVVEPALRAGKIVVSDRSFLSSLAYQWEAQWLWFDTVLDVNKSAIEWVLPDVVLYMDIPVETALARTFDVVGDKWEKMGKEFFEHIVTGYRKSANLDILRWRFEFIDATGTKEDIFQTITECIHSRFQ